MWEFLGPIAASVPLEPNSLQHPTSRIPAEQLTHGIHNPRPGPKDGPIAVGTAREAGSGEGGLVGEFRAKGWVQVGCLAHILLKKKTWA